MRTYINLLLITFILAACGKDEEVNQKISKAPEWSDGYPDLFATECCVDVKVSLNQKGFVYYIITNQNISGVTPKYVRDSARSNPNPNPDALIFKRGVITVDNGGQEYLHALDGFDDTKDYYAFLVGESWGEDSIYIQSEAQMIKRQIVFPIRYQENVYLSNPALGDGEEHAYMLYFPEGYFASKEKYPTILYLHSGNERGYKDFYKLTREGLPKLVKAGQEFEYIIMAPQISGSLGSWPPGLVNEFLELMISSHRIDEARVYVTGISLGATGALSYTQYYPQKVAAVVPISTWGTYDYCKIAPVPVWAFQNQYDTKAVVSIAQTIITSINACNPVPAPPAKLTIYDSEGHDAWTVTYDKSAGHDIYEWFKSFSK